MILPNENIRLLRPYEPGEQPQIAGFIKLNTNENPYPPSPAVLRALKQSIKDRLRIYPDPQFRQLRSITAQRWRVSAEHIFVSNGSDEVLRLIFQCYLSPGDSVAGLFPTYTLYETLAQLFGATMHYYELDDDLRIPEALFKRVPHKIICLSNPNPPFGTFYDTELIALICRANPDSIIIVDEAYVDFAPKHALALVKLFDNIIVTRSFSKSFGLAGLRIGFGIAQPHIVEYLYKIKDSYNVNVMAQIAAIAALQDIRYYRQIIQNIIASRSHLIKELTKLGFNIPPSSANFFFARWCENARWIYEALKRKKILVRYFDHPRLADGLRISVGKENENKKLITALKEIVKNEKKSTKRTKTR
ncbi:histidinol-phosphate transaminase [Candidatus Sumerlaeota bacterium]|nr:histidinol-phosphate transaminase [Candidatus Sumerlaeota bacterium]